MHVVEATELLALDLFNTGARQITLSDAESHVRRLRGHPPQCPCGRCSAAAIVRPDHYVYCGLRDMSQADQACRDLMESLKKTGLAGESVR